jgi:hypothetical protein
MPFRVELWDRSDQQIRWVIAATSSVAIGHAALGQGARWHLPVSVRRREDRARHRSEKRDLPILRVCPAMAQTPEADDTTIRAQVTLGTDPRRGAQPAGDLAAARNARGR